MPIVVVPTTGGTFTQTSFNYVRQVPRRRLLFNYLQRAAQVFPVGAPVALRYVRSAEPWPATNRLSPRRATLLRFAANTNSPNISSTSGFQYFGTTTIIGTGFGASPGTVTLNGWPQTVTTWSATTITIGSTFRGKSQYGVPVSVAVNASNGTSGTFTYPAGFTPQTGWAYINLTAVNTTAAYRLTATPDLSIGDQVAWGAVNPGTNNVTVYSDATFSATANTLNFYFEVNTGDGTGWGSSALQTVGQSVTYKDIWVEIAAVVNAGLFVTPSVQWVHSQTIPYGKVISVTPASGTTVNPYTYVTLIASLGPPVAAGFSTVPTVTGQQVYFAEQALASAGLSIGQRTYQNSSIVASGYVIAQSVTGGTQQALGTIVSLTVSIGPSSATSTVIVP